MKQAERRQSILDSNDRLTRVETLVESIAKELAEVVTTTGKQYAELHRAISDSNKTPWPIYISGAGLFLVLVSLYVAWNLRDYGKLEERITANAAIIQGHIQDGHQYRVERMAKQINDMQDRYIENMEREIDAMRQELRKK